ncbi:unnamed protein product [Clonostachys rosea f. rosea IK726]|uniref:Uncharacterized protein n=3 Tax=Bionectria ochroleuca TaxID=29856 RepID=A0A0B7KGL6_BIOOC|nr:unnamed protein product [Clonostachys rosea f. rosea IK726]CAG9954600.1 unnamed protein product [Clonostachys rosea f. rosea IK726]
MADEYSLSGKVAIITGSGRENGIGAGVAYAFARHGASVVINYVSDSSAARANKVAEKVRGLGGKAAVVQGSITSRPGARHIVQSAMTEFNARSIDILVNNAGGPVKSHGSIMDYEPQELLGDFELNYCGAIYMIQEAVPYMNRGGRIINIGAMSSITYVPGMHIYSAAKAALDHTTKSLAVELGKKSGITVNVVAPGLTLTDQPLSLDEDLRAKVIDLATEKSSAANRVGTIEDVADVALFVASEKSRWITGHVFPVGGGMY